MQSVINFEILS